LTHLRKLFPLGEAAEFDGELGVADYLSAIGRSPCADFPPGVDMRQCRLPRTKISVRQQLMTRSGVGRELQDILEESPLVLLVDSTAVHVDALLLLWVTRTGVADWCKKCVKPRSWMFARPFAESGTWVVAAPLLTFSGGER
jgi:hypothetical protein